MLDQINGTVTLSLAELLKLQLYEKELLKKQEELEEVQRSFESSAKQLSVLIGFLLKDERNLRYVKEFNNRPDKDCIIEIEDGKARIKRVGD